MLLLEEALTSWVLEDYPYSVISKEIISQQVYIFYIEKKYKGERIGLIKKPEAATQDYANYISKLERSGVLINFGKPSVKLLHHSDHLRQIYTISGKTEYSPAEAICAIYPHGYISRINAMHWHGLTDKIPKVVRFTACSAAEWKKRSTNELAGINQIPSSAYYLFFPKYPKNTDAFYEELLVSSESNYHEPSRVKGTSLRFSGIGKTFIDMTRAPDECGGIEHVIDIYEEHGKKYSNQIIRELEKSARKIDIARVGFMLQKICGVNNSKLEKWQQDAKLSRGGSKVFLTGEPFSRIYDEDWSISLNFGRVEKYGSEH